MNVEENILVERRLFVEKYVETKLTTLFETRSTTATISEGFCPNYTFSVKQIINAGSDVFGVKKKRYRPQIKYFYESKLFL